MSVSTVEESRPDSHTQNSRVETHNADLWNLEGHGAENVVQADDEEHQSVDQFAFHMHILMCEVVRVMRGGLSPHTLKGRR